MKMSLFTICTVCGIISIAICTISLVNAQENIPNPETNGDIKIGFAMYPNPELKNEFLIYPPTVRMSFTEQNLTQFNVMNIPDRGVTPTASTRPTSFSFGFYIEIPVSPQSSSEQTTLVKRVGGWFDTYKVQEYPQVNERHVYGRGTISVGNETWWRGEGVYMESLSQQPIYGMIFTGTESLF